MDCKNDLIKFWEFVGKHKLQHGVGIMTHTSLGEPKGAFSFTGSAYEKFMRRYVNVIKKYPSTNLHFVERPNDTTFLFFDFDFNHSDACRYYTNENIIGVIKILNEFIINNFEVTNKNLISFITEKPKPTSKANGGLFKDGPHIYYPYLPMTISQRYYVTEWLINRIENDDIFDNIPFVNEIKSVIDTSIISSNGILMYGSRKEGSEPYTLTNVYDMNGTQLNLDEYNDIDEIVYTLSNRKYDDNSAVKALNDTIENDIELNTKTKKKKNEINVQQIKDTTSKIKNRICKIDSSKLKEIDLAKELVKLMSVNRATDFFSWRRVAFAMYSVSDTLLPDFITFSKKCMYKYKENKVSCESIWEAAKNYSQYYTIGSLRHWAKMDNEIEYFNLIRSSMDELFGKAETARHADIADIIYELYKDQFVCVNIKGNDWYEFQNHRWVRVPNGYTLANIISTSVRRLMILYCSERIADIGRNINMNTTQSMKMSTEHDLMSNRLKKLINNADKLGDMNVVKNVIDACTIKFYVSKFLEKLDGNSCLLGFNNGVYDLNEGCFRDGLPTDYVSFSVGYDYEEFNENDQVFENIKKYFKEVQTDEEMREYMLTFFASTLRGIPDQKFHIWTGVGGNGKSMTVILLKQMLGDYYGTLPITFLTSKQNNRSSLSPELIKIKGKRFIVFQEPEHNDTLYVGQMKLLASDDTIQARTFYSEPVEFVLQCACILTCNTLPQIPSDDNGTWRRLRVTPWDSCFVVNPNPKEPKEFKIDVELGEKIKTWARPFLWYILKKYYPIYENGYNGCKYTIKEPLSVTNLTTEYKMDSDMYMEFLEENIKITNDNDDIETINTIYMAFDDWYSTSYKERTPAKKELIKYLKKRKFIINKGNIHGIQMCYAPK